MLRVILLIALIVGGFGAPVQQGRASNSTGPPSAPVTAMNFMKRYGYLAGGTSDSEALYKESAVTDAIRTLQRFGNIPETGDLDNDTLQLMQSPRCGLPDIIRISEHPREKRYIIGSKGWQKRNITYFVANWSPKLGEEPVIDEIERAFDAWSGYTRLNFKPVNNPRADIIIAFGQGPHGDEYPFDGPGNILAHAFFPYEMGSYGGDIHFDDDENWTIRPTDQNNGETDFFTVAVHELGHSLGLSHSPVPSSIMFPYYKGYSSGFQLGYDDVLAMYHLYISQPPTESEAVIDNDEESEETSTKPSTTTSSYHEETEETLDVEVNVVVTEVSPNVTFLGDYETVEEHRGHESTSASIASTLREAIIPDICSGGYDSVSLFGGELFIFKGQYVWRFGTRGIVKSGYPMKLQDVFREIPANVTRIDAAYERKSDQSIVLFSGRFYWVYDGDRLIENSPRLISNYGLPIDLDKVDAAQVWPKNGKVYLYSGNQFWRYDENTGTPDAGYPQDISRWRGVPRDVDAAMTWTDGCTYFFKGTDFWRFDDVLIKTEDQYPQRVADFWFRCD